MASGDGDMALAVDDTGDSGKLGKNQPWQSLVKTAVRSSKESF